MSGTFLQIRDWNRIPDGVTDRQALTGEETFFGHRLLGLHVFPKSQRSDTVLIIEPVQQEYVIFL